MKTFELSHYSPLNTVLTDLESGEKVVCISSSRNYIRGTTKISHYVDTPSQARDSEVDDSDQHVQDGSPQSDTPGLEETARVNWNFVTGSWVVYKGEIITIAKLMPATNLTKSARTFAGPDGHDYVWRMGPTSCALYRKNGDGEKETKVVNVDPNYIARKCATMEVDNSLLSFLDLVLLTWVFIEQRRAGKAS